MENWVTLLPATQSNLQCVFPIEISQNNHPRQKSVLCEIEKSSYQKLYFLTPTCAFSIIIPSMLPFSLSFSQPLLHKLTKLKSGTINYHGKYSRTEYEYNAKKSKLNQRSIRSSHFMNLLWFYFLLNDEPSANFALPPVGVHNKLEHFSQAIAVWAWLKTVAMLKHPWHFISIK